LIENRTYEWISDQYNQAATDAERQEIRERLYKIYAKFASTETVEAKLEAIDDLYRHYKTQGFNIDIPVLIGLFDYSADTLVRRIDALVRAFNGLGSAERLRMTNSNFTLTLSLLQNYRSLFKGEEPDIIRVAGLEDYITGIAEAVSSGEGMRPETRSDLAQLRVADRRLFNLIVNNMSPDTKNLLENTPLLEASKIQDALRRAAGFPEYRPGQVRAMNLLVDGISTEYRAGGGKTIVLGGAAVSRLDHNREAGTNQGEKQLIMLSEDGLVGQAMTKDRMGEILSRASDEVVGFVIPDESDPKKMRYIMYKNGKEFKNQDGSEITAEQFYKDSSIIYIKWERAVHRYMFEVAGMENRALSAYNYYALFDEGDIILLSDTPCSISGKPLADYMERIRVRRHIQSQVISNILPANFNVLKQRLSEGSISIEQFIAELNKSAMFDILPGSKDVDLTMRGRKLIRDASKTALSRFAQDDPLVERMISNYWEEFVLEALRANIFYREGFNYTAVERSGRVVGVSVVDEVSKETKPNMSFGEGMQQAIEIMAGVESIPMQGTGRSGVTPETSTLMSSTIKQFLQTRIINDFAAASGTMQGNRLENKYDGKRVESIKGLTETLDITAGYTTTETEQDKWDELTSRLRKRHGTGHPEAIFVESDEKARWLKAHIEKELAAELKEQGIIVHIGNGRDPAGLRDAIQYAGYANVITIFTNIAHRGVDINIQGRRLVRTQTTDNHGRVVYTYSVGDRLPFKRAIDAPGLFITTTNSQALAMIEQMRKRGDRGKNRGVWEGLVSLDEEGLANRESLEQQLSSLHRLAREYSEEQHKDMDGMARDIMMAIHGMLNRMQHELQQKGAEAAYFDEFRRLIDRVTGSQGAFRGFVSLLNSGITESAIERSLKPGETLEARLGEIRRLVRSRLLQQELIEEMRDILISEENRNDKTRGVYEDEVGTYQTKFLNLMEGITGSLENFKTYLKRIDESGEVLRGIKESLRGSESLDDRLNQLRSSVRKKLVDELSSFQTQQQRSRKRIERIAHEAQRGVIGALAQFNSEIAKSTQLARDFDRRMNSEDGVHEVLRNIIVADAAERRIAAVKIQEGPGELVKPSKALPILTSILAILASILSFVYSIGAIKGVLVPSVVKLLAAFPPLGIVISVIVAILLIANIYLHQPYGKKIGILAKEASKTFWRIATGTERLEGKSQLGAAGLFWMAFGKWIGVTALFLLAIPGMWAGGGLLIAAILNLPILASIGVPVIPLALVTLYLSFLANLVFIKSFSKQLNKVRDIQPAPLKSGFNYFVKSLAISIGVLLAVQAGGGVFLLTALPIIAVTLSAIFLTVATRKETGRYYQEKLPVRLGWLAGILGAGFLFLLGSLMGIPVVAAVVVPTVKIIVAFIGVGTILVQSLKAGQAATAAIVEENGFWRRREVWLVSFFQNLLPNNRTMIMYGLMIVALPFLIGGAGFVLLITAGVAVLILNELSVSIDKRIGPKLSRVFGSAISQGVMYSAALGPVVQFAQTANAVQEREYRQEQMGSMLKAMRQGEKDFAKLAEAAAQRVKEFTPDAMRGAENLATNMIKVANAIMAGDFTAVAPQPAEVREGEDKREHAPPASKAKQELIAEIDKTIERLDTVPTDKLEAELTQAHRLFEALPQDVLSPDESKRQAKRFDTAVEKAQRRLAVLAAPTTPETGLPAGGPPPDKEAAKEPEDREELTPPRLVTYHGGIKYVTDEEGTFRAEIDPKLKLGTVSDAQRLRLTIIEESDIAEALYTTKDGVGYFKLPGQKRLYYKKNNSWYFRLSFVPILISGTETKLLAALDKAYEKLQQQRESAREAEEARRIAEEEAAPAPVSEPQKKEPAVAAPSVPVAPAPVLPAGGPPPKEKAKEPAEVVTPVAAPTAPAPAPVVVGEERLVQIKNRMDDIYETDFINRCEFAGIDSDEIESTVKPTKEKREELLKEIEAAEARLLQTGEEVDSITAEEKLRKDIRKQETLRNTYQRALSMMRQADVEDPVAKETTESALREATEILERYRRELNDPSEKTDVFIVKKEKIKNLEHSREAKQEEESNIRKEIERLKASIAYIDFVLLKLEYEALIEQLTSEKEEATRVAAEEARRKAEEKATPAPLREPVKAEPAPAITPVAAPQIIIPSESFFKGIYTRFMIDLYNGEANEALFNNVLTALEGTDEGLSELITMLWENRDNLLDEDVLGNIKAKIEELNRRHSFGGGIYLQSYLGENGEHKAATAVMAYRIDKLQTLIISGNSVDILDISKLDTIGLVSTIFGGFKPSTNRCLIFRELGQEHVSTFLLPVINGSRQKNLSTIIADVEEGGEKYFQFKGNRYMGWGNEALRELSGDDTGLFEALSRIINEIQFEIDLAAKAGRPISQDNCREHLLMSLNALSRQAAALQVILKPLVGVSQYDMISAWNESIKIHETAHAIWHNKELEKDEARFEEFKGKAMDVVPELIGYGDHSLRKVREEFVGYLYELAMGPRIYLALSDIVIKASDPQFYNTDAYYASKLIIHAIIPKAFTPDQLSAAHKNPELVSSIFTSIPEVELRAHAAEVFDDMLGITIEEFQSGVEGIEQFVPEDKEAEPAAEPEPAEQVPAAPPEPVAVLPAAAPAPAKRPLAPI
ncbi:MAG: hypothetical protein HQ572_00355, partial [Candidatus Omnitrophica bacterium]|nr:hypothetical protein [Candidatus Omnitrophota bacterium]